jgi:glutathione S-transferase
LPAKLYAVPASHPCAAIEEALRLKGVAYRRIDMIPVVAKLVMWRRFGALTVPGIEFEDGERVLGSRAIVRALEHRAPDPPLLPADGRERKLIEEAEQWGDEVLQPLARRIVWAALRRAPAAMESYAEGAALPVPGFARRATAPVLAAAASRVNGATDADVRSDLINLGFHLDRADRWLEAGAMGGEQPNAADLQVGSGLRLLQTLEDVAPRIDARESGRLARRLFPDYPGTTPAGALPREWLDARPPGER